MAGCCPWRLLECLETVYRTVYKEKKTHDCYGPFLHRTLLMYSVDSRLLLHSCQRKTDDSTLDWMLTHYTVNLTKRRTGSSVVERRIAMSHPIILMSRVRSSFSPFLFLFLVARVCLHKSLVRFIFMSSSLLLLFTLHCPFLLFTQLAIHPFRQVLSYKYPLLFRLLFRLLSSHYYYLYFLPPPPPPPLLFSRECDYEHCQSQSAGTRGQLQQFHR